MKTSEERCLLSEPSGMSIMQERITSYAKRNRSSANVLHKLGFMDEKEISYECNGGEIKTEGILCRYVANP